MDVVSLFMVDVDEVITSLEALYALGDLEGNLRKELQLSDALIEEACSGVDGWVRILRTLTPTERKSIDTVLLDLERVKVIADESGQPMTEAVQVLRRLADAARRGIRPSK